MAKEKKEAEAIVEVEKAEKPTKDEPKVDVEKFIARKLSAINEMDDEAKAKRNASRVLANRKGY